MVRTKVDFFLLLLFVFERITEAVNRSCEHTLNSTSGFITSPNYPNDYPNGISCVWKIRAPRGHYIELTFHDFDVEPYEGCKTDVLEIKDGSTSRCPLLGPQYCNGRHPPRVVTSSKNHLRLWFSTDSTLSYRGFNASYRTIYDPGCGETTINATHGTITSPRFPLNYPRRKHCEWKIKVPDGKHVALKFVAFEVESMCPTDRPCECKDFVVIRDGHSPSARNLGKHCMGAPPPIVASGSELAIKFSSDRYGRQQGFQAIFTQSSTRYCGGDFFSENGTIESPLFDLNGVTTYPDYSNCIWVITPPPGTYVSVRFSYMDVLPSDRGDCSSDYVEIRDGTNEYARPIGYYCNAYFPRSISSSSNSMFIRFISDWGGTAKGFQMKFKTHNKSCTSSLGLEDYRVSNAQVFATSSFKIRKWPHSLDATQGRLNGPYAWCTQEQRFDIDGEYMQIDFSTQMKYDGHTDFRNFRKITKIATQGYLFGEESYYVTSYRLQYQVSGDTFEYYVSLQDARKGKSYTVFEANHSHNDTVENELSPSIVLKKFRILPLTYHSVSRKLKCMRVEVFGCKLADLPGRGIVLTKSADRVTYGSHHKSNKTWVISPQRIGDNSVILLKVEVLSADCNSAGFVISYTTKVGKGTEVYCQKRIPRIILVPASVQLWARFYMLRESPQYQQIQFFYQVQNLGLGRVLTSERGVINGNRLQLSRDNLTSIWLLKMRRGRRIYLRFENMRLPKSKHSPYLLVKAGLLDTSPRILRLDGIHKPRPLKWFGNELRIEYHPNQLGTLQPKQYDHGFVLRYSIWQTDYGRDRGRHKT